MRAIYRASPEKGDRVMHVSNGLSNLGALSARGTFRLVFPGVARNALTPGYLLPRLRRWLSELLHLVPGKLDQISFSLLMIIEGHSIVRKRQAKAHRT